MSADSENQPLSISQLTAMLRDSMTEQFGNVVVEGELSDVVWASSGHVYMNLKDPSARISAVVWRSTASKLRFELEEGQQVICRGGLDVYAPRGSYQLIVRSIQPTGTGALELAFQQLYKRLKSEGLFDPERKRPIPPMPERVAVVTSPQGAAIRDFLEVITRRWPSIELVILPVRVQGEGSANEIAGAIRVANVLNPVPDVIVVCRGGGSLEDLWSFNEEIVCRAVFNSAIPVVSGVGHEIDVTLCDLTADLRALTPSEAAERIVPDRNELIRQLKGVRSRLANALLQRVRTAQQTLDLLASRPALAGPLDRLEKFSRKLDELRNGLQRPMERKIERSRHAAMELAGRLESLNPLSVLTRGYSITTNEGGRVVSKIADTSDNQLLQTRVQDGTITSRVQSADAID